MSGDNVGKILFFDDYLNESRTFLLLLEQMAIRIGSLIIEEKLVHKVEEYLRTERFEAVVLDVMASRHGRTDRRAGLQILKECRSGRMGRLNNRTLIFIRTARGDVHIKQDALELGADRYFDKGGEDASVVVDEIEKAVLKRRQRR